MSPDQIQVLVKGFQLDQRVEAFPASEPLHDRARRAAAAIGEPVSSVYRWRRELFPRETVPDELRQLIMLEYGLASPHLKGKALRCACEAAGTAYGISWRSIYRWRGAMVARGSAARQPKATAGRSHLDPDVISSLEELHTHPGARHLSHAAMTRQLQARHPDASINYHAIRRERARLDGRYRRTAEPAWRVEVDRVHSRWQVDDSLSDLFIQAPDRAPFRVPISCILDDRTRCIMYAHYVEHADRGSYASLLFHAMRKVSDEWPMCGVPDRIRDDHGKVFQSDMAAGALEAFGIEQDTSKPYHPEGKGKQERAFRTIHEMFEREQPGWCPGDNQGDEAVDPQKQFRLVGDTWVDPRSGQLLHGVQSLNAALHEWIVAEYHEHHHRTIGMTPMAAWQFEMARHPDLNIEPPADLLHLTLLTPVDDGGTRMVTRRTIQYQGLAYSDPALASYEGVRVHVRYCHDDLTRVWAFATGRRGAELGDLICEVPLLPTFVVGDTLSRRDYGRMKARQARESKLERQALDRVAARHAAQLDLHEPTRRAAANMPRPLAPAPGTWAPPPDPDADELAGLEIAGIPVAASDR